MHKESEAEACKTNNYLFLLIDTISLACIKIFFKIARILIEQWFNWIMLAEISQGFILKLHFWHLCQNRQMY